MSEGLTVTDFLAALGLQELESVLLDNGIDAEVLRSITAEDLEEMDIAGDAATGVLWGVAHLVPIHAWLEELGLSEYLKAFGESRIELNQVASLDKDDLKEIGVSVLGHRKKILPTVQKMSLLLLSQTFLFLLLSHPRTVRE